jgi:membrane protein DedA with SNARE-associated domain
MEELISTYGYTAIAIGSFLEGETILVLGGFAAHRGYLELPWVIAWAFVGTLFGDQLYFYIGRVKGQRFIQKRPAWQAKSEKLLRMLDRHQVWLILGFRFLYGLRTVAPFLIGASDVSPKRFLVLNIVGASVWAIVIGTLGYLFGHSLEIMLGELKHYEVLLFALLASAGLLLWLGQRMRRVKDNRK